MSDNQIRDLFHLVKSEDLTGQQIKQGFGEIFLSKDTIDNQMISQEIVNQVSSVKTPFYGSPIPGSFVFATAPGDNGIIPFFTPTANKTYQLIAADVLNLGAGAMTVNFGFTNGAGDFLKVSGATPTPGGQGGFSVRNAFYFDASTFPCFVVETGTANDAIGQIIYAEVVQ